MSWVEQLCIGASVSSEKLHTQLSGYGLIDSVFSLFPDESCRTLTRRESREGTICLFFSRIDDSTSLPFFPIPLSNPDFAMLGDSIIGKI